MKTRNPFLPVSAPATLRFLVPAVALALVGMMPAEAGWRGHGHHHHHHHVVVTRPLVRVRPVVVRPAPVVVAPVPVVRVHPVPVSVAVQARLKARGYYHATVDGIVGPATSAAIRAFQYDHGLAVTGTITPALLRALHL